MKLIKINKDHYIVVDDSEIKKGDYFYSIRNLIEKAIINYPSGEHIGKITHSTQPLESIVTENSFKRYEFIPLQEVKELIGEVDVEKKYTEEDIRKAILMARVRIENVSPKYSIDEIFLSLQPKTEWEVEIIDGLKLK